MKFYIKDFCYIKSAEEIDVSSIPPLVRRKLSPIDKAALSTMIKVFDNNNFQLQVKQMIGSTAFIGNAKLNKINAKSAAAAYLEANKNMYPLSRAKLAEYII